MTVKELKEALENVPDHYDAFVEQPEVGDHGFVLSVDRDEEAVEVRGVNCLINLRYR